MARVTVEDCLNQVDTRFQLILVASKRARQLAKGADATVDWDKDKPTVVALREVAAGNVGVSILDEPDFTDPIMVEPAEPSADDFKL